MGMTESKNIKDNRKLIQQRDLPDISIAFKATQKRLLSQKTNTFNQEIASQSFQSNQKENKNHRTDRNQQQQPKNQNTQMQQNVFDQEPQQLQGQIIQQQNNSEESFHSIKQVEIEQNGPLYYEIPNKSYKQIIVPKQLLIQQEHPKFQQIQQPHPLQSTPMQSMQQNQFEQQDQLHQPLQNFHINQQQMQYNQHDQGNQYEILQPIQSNFNFNQSLQQNDSDKQHETNQPELNFNQDEIKMQQIQDKRNNQKPVIVDIPDALLFLEVNEEIQIDDLPNKQNEIAQEEDQIKDEQDENEVPKINKMQLMTSYNARAGNLQTRNFEQMNDDASMIIEQKCFICSHNMQTNYLMLSCSHQIHKNCAKKTRKNNQYVYHCSCGEQISNHLFA
ncbi:hypothetical protein pb186bvf_008561 [Paramecium bursaria]